MAVSETIKLALPFVSSLFFLVEAHGQSLPPYPVNEPNNKEIRYSELQQEPKIRPPHSIPAIAHSHALRLLRFAIHIATATAKLR